MDVNAIFGSIDIASEHGHLISPEDSIALHNALLILQNENHFRKVFYWGRIFGTDHDYHIAYGFKKDVLLDRTYYYSVTTCCTGWVLLPLPTKTAKQLTPLCFARFQGDPLLMVRVQLDDAITNKTKAVLLKEEDRLAATVFLINLEAVAVPRGALFKRPDGVVVENLCFEGLSVLEARELDYFLHCRPPTRKWTENLLIKDDYNYAIDFLDPLSLDLPIDSSWIYNLTADQLLVVLKSTYWPGMVIFHYVKTSKYGFIYFGNGKKSLDIPFGLL